MPGPKLPDGMPDWGVIGQFAATGMDDALSRLFGPSIEAATLREIPVGPFYWTVSREDRLPIPPMSDRGEGLDEPPGPRQMPGPPTLRAGDAINPGRDLLLHPELAIHGWPLRLYELRDLGGLEWKQDHPGQSPRLCARSAVIDREVPDWRYFGPYGDGIPELLEQVWRLDPQRIAALGPTRVVMPEAIPIPLLPKPDGPAGNGVQNAVGCAMNWVETRSWVAGVGGGFYYRGCYDTYVVDDHGWLTAMGLAYNAAVAIAGGPAVATRERASALTAWRDLVGEPS